MLQIALHIAPKIPKIQKIQKFTFSLFIIHGTWARVWRGCPITNKSHPHFSVLSVYISLSACLYTSLQLSASLHRRIYLCCCLNIYPAVYSPPKRHVYLYVLPHSHIYLYIYGMWDSIHKYLYAVGYRYTKTAW